MLLKDHAALRPALLKLAKGDPHFKKHITVADIEAIPHTIKPCDFMSFARTIVGQQLSTRAAQTIWGRVHAAITPFEPARVRAVHHDTLRALGLSGRKVEYMHALADAVMEGRFDPAHLHAMPDDEVVAAITALRGFGVWSAHMVLMFALNRADVFAPGDLGLREGLRITLNLDTRPTEGESERLAARWAPHRTAASLLLWQVVHKNKPEKK